MMKRIFGSITIALSLALLTACSAHKEEEAGEWLTVAVQAGQNATKSTLEDDGAETSFTFENGDEIGFFADGIINNAKLTCTDGASGSFNGRILVKEAQTVYHPAVDYYAYYPYSSLAGQDPSALKGTLPATQSAPFDGRADILVADPVTDVYDVDAFPALSFDFDTHLFAVVKLNIINSNDAYAGEEILSIGLQSDDTPLAGQFTFSAIDGEVEFSEDPNYLSNKVLVEYATPPTLGKGTTHSVYAVVNASSYASGTLKLVVNTTNYIFTVPSRKALKLKSYNMTSLAITDVASASRRKRVRSLVLWGASSMGASLLKAVQAQLGPNWNVIRSGVAGDTAQQIAARQGGIPMYTQDTSFTIPASSEEYVDIDDIYWFYNDKYGYETGEWTFKSGYTPELNPLIIQGIECEISWDTGRSQRRIRRLADGEYPVEIPARSPVSTHGSRALADVDVIVVYAGLNGRGASPDNVLIDLHDRMAAHLTDPGAVMIVFGFYPSSTDFPQYWTQAYSTAMTDHYGNFFLDLRVVGGGNNAIPLMKELGQITDESQISDTDWTYINRGDWPLSWFRKAGDVHANDQYGVQVQAILLRRRMAELGLL